MMLDNFLCLVKLILSLVSFLLTHAFQTASSSGESFFDSGVRSFIMNYSMAKVF